jgi:hypothetical protein
MHTARKNTFFNIYFGLISGISFVWLCIATIVFAYDLISQKIINNEEYLSQNYRNIERCDNIDVNLSTSKTEGLHQWSITIEDKEACIKKAKDKLLLKRSIDSKETLLLSWLRMVILLIIFPIHFMYFRKQNK